MKIFFLSLFFFPSKVNSFNGPLYLFSLNRHVYILFYYYIYIYINFTFKLIIINVILT